VGVGLKSNGAARLSQVGSTPALFRQHARGNGTGDGDCVAFICDEHSVRAGAPADVRLSALAPRPAAASVAATHARPT